jgi:hypothetical protein
MFQTASKLAPRLETCEQDIPLEGETLVTKSLILTKMIPQRMSF